MKNLQKAAREHSIINGYAAVVREGNDTYYTDSEDILQSDTRWEHGEIIAEYYKGERVPA